VAGHNGKNPGPRCAGTNRRGERCGRLATDDGFCAFHSGAVDPAEMGRKGRAAKRVAARRATIAELRRENRRLKAELWRVRHAAELDERLKPSGQRLEAMERLIDAL
jgi:hypothetical protein